MGVGVGVYMYMYVMYRCCVCESMLVHMYTCMKKHCHGGARQANNP